MRRRRGVMWAGEIDIRFFERGAYGAAKARGGEIGERKGGGERASFVDGDPVRGGKEAVGYPAVFRRQVQRDGSRGADRWQTTAARRLFDGVVRRNARPGDGRHRI